MKHPELEREFRELEESYATLIGVVKGRWRDLLIGPITEIRRQLMIGYEALDLLASLRDWAPFEITPDCPWMEQIDALLPLNLRKEDS